MDEEMMDTISHTERLRLEQRDRKLNALEAAGVDNWGGYGYAMEIFHAGGDE